MRIHFSGRLYQHQQLESHPGEPHVKHPRRLGLGSKAVSCRHFRTNSSDDVESRPAMFHRTGKSHQSHLTTTFDLKSRLVHVKNPKLVPVGGKKPLFRSMFSSREDSIIIPHEQETTTSLKINNNLIRSTKQKPSAWQHKRERLVRTERVEEKTKSTSKSEEFDSPLLLAPPPLTTFRRSQSLPQARTDPRTSFDKASIMRRPSKADWSELLRDMNDEVPDELKELKIRQLRDSVHNPSKMAVSDPLEHLPCMKFNRGKIKPVKQTLPHSNRERNRGSSKHKPIREESVDIHEKSIISCKPMNSLTIAYKQIMVEFGDESSEATTGW